MYQIDIQHPVHVHFIGIGGISMSGLAELLLSRGFPVSGSDGQRSELTDHLCALGAQVCIGHRAEQVAGDVGLVVYTAAIHPDNPEYAAAMERGIPMLSRAQLLGELMLLYETPIAIAGTHGKTTTTSMVSEILLQADLDPTLSIGGVLPSIGSNLRIGHGPHFVAEACEYTNSYHDFHPRISIILNVEEDHMDFFRDIDEIRDSFHRFAALLPEDGALIINGEIAKLSAITDGLACRIVTYGSGDGCDYYALPEEISYDELGRTTFTMHGPYDQRVALGVVGAHNVSNALAAIALADLLGIERETTLLALRSFTGTQRRYERKGEIGGVTIIDDYAHHPTEIRATLQAAQNYPHRRLYCVFQPHTYSRTRAFLDDFAEALRLADVVILADIYAARETDHLGVSSGDIAQRLKAMGCEAHHFPYFDDIETYLLQNALPGDLILTMGAGDVYRIGEALLGHA